VVSPRFCSWSSTLYHVYYFSQFSHFLPFREPSLYAEDTQLFFFLSIHPTLTWVLLKSYSGCSLADLFFDNWMHWMQGPLTYWQSFHYNQTSISAPSHHFSTSLQHSLLISCNSCSSTIIILSTNNWSLFVICFTMPLEAAYHSLHQPHSTSK